MDRWVDRSQEITRVLEEETVENLVDQMEACEVRVEFVSAEAWRDWLGIGARSVTAMVLQWLDDSSWQISLPADLSNPKRTLNKLWFALLNDPSVSIGSFEIHPALPDSGDRPYRIAAYRC